MAIFLFVILFYGIPLIFYLIPHKISIKKWLITYSLFWITILCLALYDIIISIKTSNIDDDFSLGWVIVTGFIFLNCMTAIIGVISRAIVLHFTNNGQEINLALVHLTSFITLQVFAPFLMGILVLIISWIVDLF